MTEELWRKVGDIAFRAAFDTDDVRLTIQQGCYADGNTALRAVIADTGETYAVLSVNPGEPVEKGCVYLKTWDWSADLISTLWMTGFVEIVPDADPYVAGSRFSELYKVVR